MLRYTQGWRWKSKHESFEELKSDVFAVVNTWSAYVTIADADLIKEAASRRVEIPKPTQEYRAFNIFGSNILTTEGDEWRKHRKIVSPHFSETNNLLVHHETQRLVAEMCEEWETTAVRAPDSPDEFQVNVSQDMSRLTLFVFSAAGFGRKFSWSVRDQPDEGHRYSFEQVIGLVLKNLALNFFLPKWIFKLPIDPFRTIGRQFDEFEQYVRRMARQAQDQVSEKPDNLLEAIVGASVQDDEHNAVRLTEDEVVGDIFIFLLAGHDTTATTLTFALTLLGFHRDKQERLYQEVVGHLAASNGDGDGDGISDSDGAAATASYKDCSSIEYVSAIMNETLRLFPPVTSVFKVCEVDQNLGGYWIPKGTRVDLNAVGLHYNRRYWGPDPAEFRPERFLPPNTWNRAALIPFSAGARSCVGKRFSQVEFAAALVHLVQRYEWRVAPGVSEACLQEASGIILKMKRPPPILFKRRSTAQ
ncbi:cytochrome P450 [Polychytrium aggregatum]|uniref:cytochrome P450 n=1 Tax=Polychytrium aggregatum TaxID=110093 RepID=UPI0022FE9518|nr:cytochrome P450 [Polychytrium aggregatum]KAI9197172.1 cytochrome P450 [Polychytrium aggregatum]